VNDAIYVFGGNEILKPTSATLIEKGTDIMIGEKFALRENKWREVVSRSTDSHSAVRAMQMLQNNSLLSSHFCPASLLYE